MIHVDFMDFEDMVGFARQLVGQVQPVSAMDTPSVVQQTAMVPPTPQAAQALPAAERVPAQEWALPAAERVPELV